MEEPIEILFIAFCGVVLTFALLFVGCWCLISCSFFCLKYIYCGDLSKMISFLSLNSGNQSEDLDSEDDSSSYCGSMSQHSQIHENDRCEESTNNIHSHMMRHNNSVGSDVIEIDAYWAMETESHSQNIVTGKMTPEELPPDYDFPPAYDSLFPQNSNNDVEKKEITIVDVDAPSTTETVVKFKSTQV